MEDSDVLLDATTALVPPLLTAIDLLTHAGRHMHPPNLPELVESVEPYRAPLKEGLEQFRGVDWPQHLTGFVNQLTESGELALQSFNEFLSSGNQSQPAMAAYRAMGFNTKAIEALYPISQMLPPVSRFFLDPEQRQDGALLERIAGADASRDDVGIMHANNERQERGGFSLYVPEYYDGERVPLIVCLHGGSGHGRAFLWTWLRTARSRNCILVSPTSQEGTWSLMGPDVDSGRLDAIVDYATQQWNIDSDRVLLTGMSDGGTFSYVSGLRGDAPYTHLAPSSASFHPMLVEVADGTRIKGLPMYIMHGALDWMFPIDVARMARDAFTAAGADVVYREIEDLSHTYPIEENAKIVDWLTS
jgi:phospholipase/carboxylesterase